MILEIRFGNLYSIKEKVKIDFRAGDIKTYILEELEDNYVKVGGEKILKSVGIFGANASGKSNIIKAILYGHYIIRYSHTFNPDFIFPHETFRLDESYSRNPSFFSVVFILDGIQYDYAFTFDKNGILEESMDHYPKGNQELIFNRIEGRSSDRMKNYEGNMDMFINPWDVARNTSNKNLFISRANNFGDRPFAQKIYNFLSTNFINNLQQPPYEISKRIFEKEKDSILKALRIADIDIIDYKLIFNDNRDIRLPPLMRVIPDDGNEQLFGSGFKTQGESFEIITFHKKHPNVAFKLDEESTGTKKLLFGIISLLGLIGLRKVFLIDEIDLHLHTKIVEFIIGLFNANEGSQLIFTSHNTNLMDLSKLRKDQICFANKKPDGSTELYSLFDFEDWNESINASKSYLEGRFDAVPNVDESITTLKSLIDG